MPLFSTNTPSSIESRPPGREAWAFSFHWLWAENELWTPHALFSEDTGHSRHHSNKETQKLWGGNVSYRIKCYDYWSINKMCFVCVLFSVARRLIFKMQMKEKRRFWKCYIIGYFSHLTPTTARHNVRALTNIASTVLVGRVIVMAWREFSKAFYCLNLFVSPMKSHLV